MPSMIPVFQNDLDSLWGQEFYSIKFRISSASMTFSRAMIMNTSLQGFTILTAT